MGLWILFLLDSTQKPFFNTLPHSRTSSSSARTLVSLFIFVPCIYLLVCTHIHRCHTPMWKSKGQLSWVCSPLLPCGSQELNSSHQGWRQAPLPMEPSHGPRELIYLLWTFSLTLAFLFEGWSSGPGVRKSLLLSYACSSYPYILIKVILEYLMLEGSCRLIVNCIFFFHYIL